MIMDEMTKVRETEVEFWREQFYSMVAKNVKLKEKVEVLEMALKEHEAASEFLSASGDNPLDYLQEVTT